MKYFKVMNHSRVVIYEHKTFIRLATDGNGSLHLPLAAELPASTEQWQPQLHFDIYLNDSDWKVIPKQCDQKKSPNVHKSCPKIISLE